MKVALIHDARATDGAGMLADVGDVLRRRGHDVRTDAAPDLDLVLHATSPAAASVGYVRPNASVFVASLLDTPRGDEWPSQEALRHATYAVLIKTMSNVVVHRVREGAHGGAAYFMTPELGFRARPDDAGLAAAIADYVTPLAAARQVMDNRLDEDLPPELWQGDAGTRDLLAHGRKLAALNLLPSVFDISSILSERDLRLAMKLFGLKQLSYGNLSVRRNAETFWMSGRGVDKSNLAVIGRDVFLVKGYDPSTYTMLLSVPPGTDPTARVSVDAIEHYKIYRAVPQVGAIVHVHAWMENVQATQQSWPCGSEQLADEVLRLVLAEPDPGRAVVGLKNHGLTITGESLPEIFARIEGRLVRQIPASE